MFSSPTVCSSFDSIETIMGILLLPVKSLLHCFASTMNTTSDDLGTESSSILMKSPSTTSELFASEHLKLEKYYSYSSKLLFLIFYVHV